MSAKSPQTSFPVSANAEKPPTKTINSFFANTKAKPSPLERTDNRFAVPQAAQAQS